MLPLAWKYVRQEKGILLQHRSYFFWTGLTGVSLFNTFVYIAGHHSPAINLALIGTTSSPVFAIILAAIFLKEPIKPLRIVGLLLCLGGIVWLLSQGSWERLKAFRFSAGDGWVLLGALSFAIYNIMVKRKPSGVHPLSFYSRYLLRARCFCCPFI
ncbi:DMT family transporter [Paraflavitalea speifideaquila]|uniref:DMT family transporter n=1 Tax=Paraflavitalea speifideaquila TaxID=3076558 RepID=UPI0028E4B9FC|nr:DMT family transporter [Paraflavitalea speifideiaquila]